MFLMMMMLLLRNGAFIMSDWMTHFARIAFAF